MAEEIYLERDGHVATIVLNAPERMNALGLDMFRGLRRILAECEQDGEIRAIVIRGEGGKALSAGAHIGEFTEWRSSKAKAREYAQISVPAFQALWNCRHPTIAAIQGLAVGGGLGLAACCDFRVCGKSSRFGVPVKRLGLVEAHDEMAPLVRKFGASVALEILVLGEVFGVEEALRMRLVNKVVEDDKVLEAAYDMARKIAEGAPLGARWHKKFVYRQLDPRPITPAEQDEGYDCYDTEDFQIGYKAFLAKRRPTFVGR